MEDSGLKSSQINKSSLDQIAVLRYYATQKQWTLDIDQEDLAFGFMDKKMS